MDKEAEARIKINNLLTDSGWRLLDNDGLKKNVRLEMYTSRKEDSGFCDYVLLDDRDFPICVIEAKSEKFNPLIAKEQARDYADPLNMRFAIMSNGESSYFWDIENGNPTQIFRIPSQKELIERLDFKPNLVELGDEIINEDYIALSQEANFKSDPRWINEKKREDFINEFGLRLLRPYQITAINTLQKEVKLGKNRFLFEMATGTGKTVLSAAIIKMYLKTGNAKRVLFLVDRLELEDQAYKAFSKMLKGYQVQVYKDKRIPWNKAEVLVTTIQSISYEDKYKKEFDQNAFDLIISDEAHRSISGNNRSIFEYFLGHKLGLTATPKAYLKNIKKIDLLDPKELERRNMLSTYKTFGCENEKATFIYTLLDGVRDGYLISPIIVNCRTEVTTKLLSEDGYKVTKKDSDSEQEISFTHKHFEKLFFNEDTNKKFIEVFMNNAMKDPLSGEIGKTLVFAVNQNHATKLAQLFNEKAHEMFPGKYNSDFAVQVTSQIQDAQLFTNQFNDKSNNLRGTTRFLDGYQSSKTRVCVTVGMMTTGYDCTDILNICLIRPIFSPADYVQIKGRGTRKHIFEYKQRIDGEDISEKKKKDDFKIFDFFANYEYFEDKYDYKKVLELPKGISNITTVITDGPEGGATTTIEDDLSINDSLSNYKETKIDSTGMRIDREGFGINTMKAKEFKILEEFKKFVETDVLPIDLVTDAEELFVNYVLNDEDRNNIEQGNIGAFSSRPDFRRNLINLGRTNIELITNYIKTNLITA